MVSIELDCNLLHPQVGKNDSHKPNGLLGKLNKRMYLPSSESESCSIVSDSLRSHGLSVREILHEKVEVNIVPLCLTLCDPIDYIVHGILQARKLEWVAFPFSRGSS